jgi:hypothetical protein
MNLKAKVYEQERKVANEQKLTARLAILKEMGLDETAQSKDARVKKIKADIRKTVRRLNSIATRETLLADKKKAKIKKLAAKKPPAKAGDEKKPAAKKAKGATKETKPKAKKSATSK